MRMRFGAWIAPILMGSKRLFTGPVLRSLSVGVPIVAKSPEPLGSRPRPRL
jgi:hypothetical protein